MYGWLGETAVAVQIFFSIFSHIQSALLTPAALPHPSRFPLPLPQTSFLTLASYNHPLDLSPLYVWAMTRFFPTPKPLVRVVENPILGTCRAPLEAFPKRLE